MADAMDGSALVDLIVGVVKDSGTVPADAIVSVRKESLHKLASVLQSKLASEMKSGLEIQPLEHAKSGFKVSGKDGSWYYDFSADALASMMSEFLHPVVARILSDCARDE
jgi:V/A-type H+-transporting ATPase subunit E